MKWKGFVSVKSHTLKIYALIKLKLAAGLIEESEVMGTFGGCTPHRVPTGRRFIFTLVLPTFWGCNNTEKNESIMYANNLISTTRK